MPGTYWSYIWYSLQANLVGYLLAPIAMAALYNVGPLWMPVSIFLSTAIEKKYIKSQTGVDCGWLWMSVANIFSALAIIGVLFLSVPFESAHNRNLLTPFHNLLTFLLFAICVTAFAMAFVMPAKAKRPDQSTPPTSTKQECT